MKELSAALKEFSEKQELMRLAYTDGSGYPRAVPVWFVVIDDDYCIGTDTKSAKWKAIKQDPRVGWVIDGVGLSSISPAQPTKHTTRPTEMTTGSFMVYLSSSRRRSRHGMRRRRCT